MLRSGQVVVHEGLGDEDQRLRRLVIKGPIARNAKAGQFVSIRVQDPALSSLDPLLRRPISLAGISPDQDEITLLYRIKGRGTEILAKTKSGELLSVMGPLGKGFSVPKEGELWLIAGGIGIFPLYPLAQSALEQGLKVRLFWGGENQKFLESAGLSQWRDLEIPLHLSTLDGSLGHRGLVTEDLQERLSQLLEQTKQEDQKKENNQKQQLDNNLRSYRQTNVSVATCGPSIMMQAVTNLCMKHQVPVEVSLEERMGCAVGACLGCICTLMDESGTQIHKKVCLDGPVFRGEEVVWDGLC